MIIISIDQVIKHWLVSLFDFLLHSGPQQQYFPQCLSGNVGKIYYLFAFPKGKKWLISAIRNTHPFP